MYALGSSKPSVSCWPKQKPLLYLHTTPFHITLRKLSSGYLSLNFSPVTAALWSWFLPTPGHYRTAKPIPLFSSNRREHNSCLPLCKHRLLFPTLVLSMNEVLKNVPCAWCPANPSVTWCPDIMPFAETGACSWYLKSKSFTRSITSCRCVTYH